MFTTLNFPQTCRSEFGDLGGEDYTDSSSVAPNHNNIFSFEDKNDR